MTISNFSQSCYPDYYDNPYSPTAEDNLNKLTINFLKAFKNEDYSDSETGELPKKPMESSDIEMKEQGLDILIKPRNWPDSEQGNKIKGLMEPFLSQHLSKIQKLAVKSSSTVHFGRKLPYRTPGLEKLALLESPLSFRVTRSGDVWVLFKEKISEGHNIRYCYSPTLGIYGAKKGIDLEKKEIYEFLSSLNQQIANSNKESPIIPILDIASVPLRKFKDPELDDDSMIEESDKYSMITPKFNFSLLQIDNTDFNSPQDVKRFLYCLKKAIFLWADLIKEQNIIHPDFNPGNILFSLDSHNIINQVKLIDLDEFTAPLPSFLVSSDGKQHETKKILLINLHSSISEALKCGLDTIYILTKNCVNKSLLLTKKNNSFAAKESVELINTARELIKGLNILAFGPLFSNFENDSNWLINKDKHLKTCIKQITIMENQVCIQDILERTNSFIQIIEKLII